MTDGPSVKQTLRSIPGARRASSWLRRLTGTTARDGSRRTILEKLPKGTVGMEVGVHLGDFSERLLSVVRPKELHLVDPWALEVSPTYARAWYGGAAQGGADEMEQRFASVKKRFGAAIAAGTVKVHRGNSDVVLEGFPDGCLDWIYIDGNHLYDFVKRDLELASRKVRPGGYIAGDDYGSAGWWEDGVTRAVNEFAGKRASGELAIFGGQFIMRNA